MNAAPEISVVIEWENVLHFEKERSEVVLHCLAERIHDLDRAVRLRLEQVPLARHHGDLSRLRLRECCVDLARARADAPPFPPLTRVRERPRLKRLLPGASWLWASGAHRPRLRCGGAVAQIDGQIGQFQRAGRLSKPLFKVKQTILWLSILVPVYNVDSYIEYCPASTLVQSLKRVEIIVVDDQSSNN